MKKLLPVLLGLSALNLLNGCGGSSPIVTRPPHASTWTWVSGAKTPDEAGVYGTQGTASPSNVPGSRQFGVSWRDSNGNFWLFGGNGFDSNGTGTQGDLNDLWKFDGTNWTWVSGSDLINQPGVYGTKGVASPSSVPGARSYSISWIDKSNNLWLFGGAQLNDLWKFDGANWTWVSGSNLNQAGVYGTKGTPSSANVPGARSVAVSWIDSIGNFWLFGGDGFDSTGTQGDLNDLWKFDGANWTWVSGSDVISQLGLYGTKGTSSPSNVPGARFGAVSSIDKSGNLWLFGGMGTDSTGAQGEFNDLWKFDGTNWTWVSGSNIVLQPGVYGTQGTASSSNVPGSRYSAVSWTDNEGNFWLFGGFGNDSTGTLSLLSDLWEFDGTNWVWMGGSQIGNGVGTYGTLGTASASNLATSRGWRRLVDRHQRQPLALRRTRQGSYGREL